jgi:hypothetical protein
MTYGKLKINGKKTIKWMLQKDEINGAHGGKEI